MPIYEYNGVHYDIDTTDPVIAKQKILASLPPPKTATDYAKDFGKSAASLGDLILGAPSALAGQATYAGARALQKSPEEATQLQNKVMSGQVPFIPSANPIGNQLGITNDPAYQNEAARRMMGYVNQGVTSVAPSVSNITGLPQSDVENMMNTGLMAAGPVAVKAAPYIAKAAPLANPMNYVRGAKGVAHGVMNPEPGMPGSAYVPLRESYYPDWAVQQFNAGKIGLNELEQSKQPSSQLFNTPQTKQALNSAETNMAGERMIPVQGRVPQAIGERIGREYVANPLTAAADIGLSLFSGAPLPISAAQKAAMAYRTGQLSKAANFDPQFASNLAKAQQEAAFNASQPAPPAGPVAPASPPPAPPAAPAPLPQLTYDTNVPSGSLNQVPIYVSPEGMASTNMRAANQAGINSKYPPISTGPGPVSPAELSQQVAASKIAESGPQAVAPASVAEMPPAPAPVVAPPVIQPKPAPVVETPPAPKADIQALKARLDQNENEAIALREPMLGRRPEDIPPQDVEAYRNQMDRLGREHVDLQKQITDFEEAAKKESRKAARAEKKRQPNNVSQMLTDDGSSTWNTLKLPENASTAEKKIATMTQANRDRLESNLKAAPNANEPMIQEYLNMFNKYRIK